MSTMTLEQVGDRLRNDGNLVWGIPNVWTCQQLADAIDAHLAQPAQAVDVGAIREVIEDISKRKSIRSARRNTRLGWADKLTRALSGEKAGPVGDDTRRLDALMENSWDLRCFDMPTGAGDADIGWRVYEHHSTEPKLREVGVAYCDDPRKAIDAALLPASPAPDKEG